MDKIWKPKLEIFTKSVRIVQVKWKYTNHFLDNIFMKRVAIS